MQTYSNVYQWTGGLAWAALGVGIGLAPINRYSLLRGIMVVTVELGTNWWLPMIPGIISVIPTLSGHGDNQ